jgi:hypothetical protein
VVVTDACQGRGIGAALVRALTARAQGRGITAFTMEVLAENRQVLAMIADHWPTAQRDLSGAYATIQVPLPQPAGGQVPLAAKEQPPPQREEASLDRLAIRY